MLIRSILKSSSSIFKHKRNLSYKCSEDANLFSTTIKVNFFTLLSTLFLNSLIVSHHIQMKEEFKNLKERLDKN